MNIVGILKKPKPANSVQSSENSSYLAGVALLSILLVVLYYMTLVPLVRDWIDLPDFSHGFLVPVISLYLLWERREKLKCPASPSNWGLPLLAFGLIVLLFGRLAAEVFTQRLSILVVIAGIVLFLLGKEHLKTIAFPLAFLLLMIPLPSILLQKITFPMQLFASRCAANALELLSIPVFREGNVINLANTSLEVAEACSGIRSVISLLTLGVLFAYFTKKILWQRIVVVLASLPIAILVNAFRVTMTGCLSHFYGARAAQGGVHEFSGFIIFLIAMALFYGLTLLLGLIKK